MKPHTLLKHAMGHHTDLAIKVLDALCPHEPRTRSDFDAHEIALTVFLAGIDKTLGMACVMLYVAGILKKEWATPLKFDDYSGKLACSKPLGKKIEKLKELGAIKSGLEDFVRRRNAFMHGYETGLRYRIEQRSDGSGIVARASMTFGPIGEFPEPFDGRSLKKISKAVISDLNSYISKQTDFDKRFRDLCRRCDKLPDFTLDLRQFDSDELIGTLTTKTNSHIGARWQQIL